MKGRTPALLAVIGAAYLFAGEAHAITGTFAVGSHGPGVIVQGANSANFVYGGNALPNQADVARAYGMTGSGNSASYNITDTVKARAIPGQPSIAVATKATKAAAIVAGAAILKSLPVIGTGLLIWDLYDKMRVRPDGNGGLLHDPGVAPVTTTGTVYQVSGYQASSSSPTTTTVNATSVADACQKMMESNVNANQYGAGSSSTYSGTLTGCVREPSPYAGSYQARGTWTLKSVRNADGFTSNSTQTRTAPEVANQTRTYCPASGTQGQPGYIPEGFAPGSDGKCPQAVQYWSPIYSETIAAWADKFPAVAPTPDHIKDIIDKGGKITGHEQTYSGPASATGAPRTTTTTTPTGTTTKTETPTYTYNYNSANNSVTWNITNTTTTVNEAGQTTTTTENETPREDENVTAPPNPALGDIPKLYERKYPEGLGGVWMTRWAGFQQTPIFTYLQTLVPSFSGGGCPAWSMPVMYTIGNTGTMDISLPCWLWSALKAIFLVSALIAARRLIFGG